jgi:hypothetical protein
MRSVQITPYASKGSRPVGRAEATTLQSAGALALAELFRTRHASGSDPLVATPTLTPGQDGKEMKSANADAGAARSLSALACLPLFTPVHGSREDAWVGAAHVGCTQVFFESQAAEAPARRALNAQDQLLVGLLRLCKVLRAFSWLRCK